MGENKIQSIKLPHCPKSNIKIVERNKIGTLYITHKHVTAYFPGGVKLVSWAHTSPLSEMMRLCKCFSRVSKSPTPHVSGAQR